MTHTESSTYHIDHVPNSLKGRTVNKEINTDQRICSPKVVAAVAFATLFNVPYAEPLHVSEGENSHISSYYWNPNVEYSLPTSEEAQQYLSTHTSISDFIRSSLPTIKKIVGDIPIWLEYMSDEEEHWEKLYIVFSIETENPEEISAIENKLFEDWLFLNPESIIKDLVISFT